MISHHSLDVRYAIVEPAPGIVRETIILDAFDKMKVQPAMRLARAQNIEGLGKLWQDSNTKLHEWQRSQGGPAPADLLTVDPTAMRVLLSMFAFIARLFNPRAARRYGLHTAEDQRLKDLLAICDYLDDVREGYIKVRLCAPKLRTRTGHKDPACYTLVLMYCMM
jgi:hypothetical protein